MKGRLTKVSDNDNSLRTKYMDGDFIQPPEVGYSFTIIGEPLTPDEPLRQVVTSTVKAIEEISSDRYLITTLNSTYELELSNGLTIAKRMLREKTNG